MRRCNTCGMEKPSDAFYWRRRENYYYFECRTCKNQKTARGNQTRMWKRQGIPITQEGYERLLQAQNGRCAICGRPATEFKRSLAVDHCHRTGAVRGLLCGPHNSALGMFGDSIDELEAAIRYLAYPPAQFL